MTAPTIVSANPMPSDIDWARVESVLGVRIVQGAPWLEVVDSAASCSHHSGFVDCACGRHLIADSPDLEWVRINGVRHGRSNCRPTGDVSWLGTCRRWLW